MRINSYNKVIAGVAVVAGMMLMGHAQAAVLVEWQDGDTKGFANWDSEELLGGTVKDDIASGSVGGRTAMVTDPDVVDETLFTDVHFTTDTGLIADGNLSAWGASDVDLKGMQFDFYANADGDGTGAPTGLGFYFADTGGHVWYYDIDPSYITDGWATYSVDFEFNYSAYGQSGWYGFADNTWASPLVEGNFTTDIATDGAVDRLGVWIAYDTFNSDQAYGIDDFGLTVPEPETYLVLGMALLSVAIVFRKRISDSLAEARAMMHA
jgi:hypothetical protein